MSVQTYNGFVDIWTQAALDSVLSIPARVPILAISGLQGSGKSTLAAQIVAAATTHSLHAAALSIDDFYLPRARRRDLARTVHPLLATRGPPGTHDLPLMLDTLDAVRNGERPSLPRFDKLADDRLPRADWTSLDRPLDLLVFEGWFLQTPPQPEHELLAPINALERREDAGGQWRHWCNEALAHAYPAVWARLDILWFLQPPGFDIVTDWRWQQEQALQAARSGRTGMTRAQVQRFVQHFERVSRQALRELPGIAGHTLALDSQRRIISHSAHARTGSPPPAHD
ncbi:MAG: kinase [Xanthomonadaceae bacterium]|jgi:D-glycerate 3-kinase|nr:kinase [Xanthomonadaceae bacterium]